MGPRSENRGYHPGPLLLQHLCYRLQWVHGPRTVVIRAIRAGLSAGDELQWVHGPRTVVIHSRASFPTQGGESLQWVHGPRTVVIMSAGGERGATKKASMGPRSENRGYRLASRRALREDARFNGSTVREPWLSPLIYGWSRNATTLQWVHGPRTVVITQVSREGNGQGELQWVHGPRTVVILDF